MNVYPNPSQGKVKIVHSEKSMNYNFYSMNGTKLKSGKISGNMSLLDLHNFANGVYLLECFSENRTYIEKILFNKPL
jgi:hypothetical protein